MKYIYVVTMYRWGDREKHSYVLGVFNDLSIAEDERITEEDNRGGKYGGQILRMRMNNIKLKKLINRKKKEINK